MKKQKLQLKSLNVNSFVTVKTSEVKGAGTRFSCIEVVCPIGPDDDTLDYGCQTAQTNCTGDC